MKLTVDGTTDALHFHLDDSAITQSEEVHPGVVLDFNADGQVIGVELLQLSNRVSKEQLKTLRFETV